jgi:hypothetical protein
MRTRKLGWPAAGLRAARCLALTLGVSVVVITLAARSAQAVDPRKARDKMVELNKQALLSYEAKDFETARDLLTKALKEAKVAGLEDDKMTARTYLHLGAVYWVGFQDQAVAIQNFSLAKKIRPDIQLTPSIETADLKSVFDMATAEAGPALQPSPGRPVTPVRPQPRAATPAAPSSVPLVGDSEGGEPSLPPLSAFSAPLMCTVPSMVPPNRELTMRCALKPGLSAKVVQVHYRSAGVEAYQVLGMRRTAKGWYIVTLPSSVMTAGSLQVYFDARNAADNEVASNGQIDSPSIIQVRKKGAGRNEEECPQDDPLCQIRRGKATDEYEAGLHRRREGAFWFGLGAGSGWGYVPAGNLEWEKKVKVSAMTTTTGMFHLLPEAGYMWGEDFGVAVQGRIEFIQQQQAVYKDPQTGEITQLAGSISGAPTTMAPAVFLRAIWYTDLTKSGNFRLSYSGDVGGGFIRFPVKPVAVAYQDSNGDTQIDWSKTIAKTDTRPIDIVLLGASVGLTWHLSRHFAVQFDGRFLTGVPHFGAVVEGTLSAQLAFGGVKGTAQPTQEEEGEGEEEVISDEPPTSDLGLEEEEE